MKSGKDLNAAMGLLGWTIDTLVERSGVSKPTISSLKNVETEEELEKFNNRTLKKIINAINKGGVRFIENGVERVTYPVYFTKGNTHEEAYLELLKDAYEHLMDFPLDKRELLIMYSDDRVSPPSVNNMYKSMRGDGIRMRQMIMEGNTYLLGATDEYRYIPKGMFINRVTLIYGDRVANETGNVLNGIIREDEIQAETQRNNFNIMWQTLKKPSESSANERFE